MQKRELSILTLSLLLALPASAMNRELAELVTRDQADRRIALSWQEAERRDLDRIAAVLRMLAEGSIKEAIDYERAALIFQHGRKVEHYQLAHSFSSIAVALEPDRNVAKQLKRLSWDRIMTTLGRPQWFGSQSYIDSKTGENVTYPIDPTVTDEQRRAIE